MGNRINELRAAGLSNSEIEAVMNSRATENYNSANQVGNQFEGRREVKMNLMSSIDNIITQIATAPVGMYPDDYVSQAQQYRAQIQQSGGLAAVSESMSKEDINQLLSQAHQAYQHNPEALGEAYNTAVEVANVVKSGVTDEQYQEQLQREELESHNNRKEDGWQLVISPITGLPLERHTGTGEVREAMTNDELLAEAQNEADESFSDFLVNGGNPQEYIQFGGGSGGSDTAMRTV